MDSTTVAALIGGAATIIAALLALIGVLLGLNHKNQKKLAQKADVIVENVQNSHDKGMRDDLDEKFQGLARLVTVEIQQLRTDLSADREESRSDMRAINRRVDAVSGRIYRLEKKKED